MTGGQTCALPICTEPATPAILKEAAQYAVDVIQDDAYLKACIANGQERFGPFGASYRIAKVVLDTLEQLDAAAVSSN